MVVELEKKSNRASKADIPHSFIPTMINTPQLLKPHVSVSHI